MSTTGILTAKRKAIWRRWPFLMTVIPLTLLFVVLLAFAVYQKLARDRLSTELARIRAAGHPVDDASMANWFSEHTSQEGTAAWREVLHVTEVGLAAFGDSGFKRLPYIGEASVPAEISPGEDWPYEQAVDEYLEWMQPVIRRIEEASHYPAPVWQPLEFRGFETLLPELQNSRNLIRLLSVEVEHALYHGDAQRALRGLESMRAIAAAFDWELVLIAEFVQIALRQNHHGMIRRSLAIDLWNETQLLALQEQLGPARDVPTRWRRVIAGERAMVIEAIRNMQLRDVGHAGSGIGMILGVPSVQEPIILAYQRIEDIGKEGLIGLSERAQRTDDALLNAGPPLFGALQPATAAFAAAIEREESSRRFTLTALAIKRFQLRHDRWPEQLSELQQVGLRPSDRTTVTAGPFGYRLAGDEVLLWTYRPGKEMQVPPVPPNAATVDDIQDVLTIIR